MKNCKIINKCLCCGNDNLETILDLNDQPLANSYHKGETLSHFPLRLNLCNVCYHLQLSHSVNPDLMFKNYLYVSGTSKTLRDYFEWFTNFTLNYIPSAKNVLDIACNDGTQLDSYKKLGLSTFGVDPAINLSIISISKGHDVVVDYFNNNCFTDKKFDIIVAQNVFAHNDYPLKFLKLCKKRLTKKGYLFIQTSQANMVVNNEFDTIYHEHISFFNTLSMSALVKRSGLHLNDVIKTDIHGTSYVFVISKRNEETENIKQDITNLISSGLNKVERYKEYSQRANEITIKLKYKIDEYKQQGYNVIGYGAAAKGNTLLNFGNIKLDFIIDDNNLKWDMLTPGMDIPIKTPQSILNLDIDKPIVFIPLAWNFYNEIKNNIKSIRNNPEDIFIRYFPELTTNN